MRFSSCEIKIGLVQWQFCYFIIVGMYVMYNSTTKVFLYRVPKSIKPVKIKYKTACYLDEMKVKVPIFKLIPKRLPFGGLPT